jgi:hypothetical protein
MDLEEGMLRKIAVSVAAVVLFVAAILLVGLTYNEGGLGSVGGLALIGTIVAFILAMAAIGAFLAD